MKKDFLSNPNLILLTDSYKVSHYKQYPKGTEKIYSYFECRGSENPRFNETLFFGLQYFLKRYLVGQVITQEMLDEAKEFYHKHFFGADLLNLDGFQYIIDKHNGRLPIKIKSILEGTVVPLKNVLFTIENTDPKCYWLTNFLETIIQQVWYPMTVATISRETKKIILDNLKKTGDPSTIDFKLHDFGFRGVSSLESAILGGGAHLINFMGSDTVPSAYLAYEYYNLPRNGELFESMPCFSIPATEHSTMTSWGPDGELDAFRTYLEEHPHGIIACVSDSWDFFRACSDYWGGELKNMVLSRKNPDGSPATLVIRPDSGEPVSTIIRGFNILMDKFGFHINEKGYKVLPSQVRMIWGDGIDIEGIANILDAMKKENISGDNIAFGMGGGLLQKCNRDTFKVAIKCSYAEINGEGKDVYKDPITQKGKKSKKGKVSLHKINGEFVTEDSTSDVSNTPDELVTIFNNGELIIDQDFTDIKKRTEL